MFVRKSLLLASIAAVGVSVASAQQAGVASRSGAGWADGTQSRSLEAFGDPLLAAAPGSTGSGLDASPDALQRQAEALAFATPGDRAPPAPDGAAAQFPSPDGPAFSPAVSVAGQPAPAPAPVPAPAPSVFAIGTTASPAPAAPPVNPFAKPVPAQLPAGAGSGVQAPAFAIEAVKSASGTPAAAKPATDETALRYYASQRDLVRVGAEIRRLKTLYPGWQPPRDLFAPVGGADEQPMWDLYAQGRYDDVRREIERIKAGKPAWTPSADLVTKLEDGETRQKVSAGARSGNWANVLTAAQARPSLLVCANIDILWNVGEGFARTGDYARAFDLYAYVLSNCGEQDRRTATFQKADALLPAEGAAALVSFGRRLPNGQGEFDSLRFDRLRKAMGEVAAGKVSRQPAAEELQAFAAFVRVSRSAADMALIGWYLYGQENWQTAAEWFRAGMDAGGGAKLTEGYVLSLRNQDRADEARTIAYQAYRTSPDMAKIYIEMVSDELTAEDSSREVDEAEVKRFAKVVTDARSPLGAQALGWRLIHDEKPEAAKEWFERSVDWKPTEEGVMGLAVAATRLKQGAEVKRIKALYRKDFPALADLQEYRAQEKPSRSAGQAGSGRNSGKANRQAGRKQGGGGGDALMAEANRQFKAGNYEEALDALDRREARHGKEYGAELLRGWSNFKLKRWNQAREVFKAQDKRRSTRDTRFGMGATTNSQYGMWN